MAAPLTFGHRRFIRREVAIGMVLGSIPPAILMSQTFGPFPMPFSTTDGFGLFLFKNAFGMGTIMTLLMTLGVRSRVRKGGAPRLDWTRGDAPVLGFIPRSVLLRAPLFGLYAAAVPGLSAFAIANAIGIDMIDRLPFGVAMAFASAAVALFLVPLILIGALSDAVPAPQREVQA